MLHSQSLQALDLITLPANLRAAKYSSNFFAKQNNLHTRSTSASIRFWLLAEAIYSLNRCLVWFVSLLLGSCTHWLLHFLVHAQTDFKWSQHWNLAGFLFFVWIKVSKLFHWDKMMIMAWLHLNPAAIPIKDLPSICYLYSNHINKKRIPKMVWFWRTGCVWVDVEAAVVNSHYWACEANYEAR